MNDDDQHAGALGTVNGKQLRASVPGAPRRSSTGRAIDLGLTWQSCRL